MNLKRLLCTVSFFVAAAAVFSQSMTGREIMEEQDRRHGSSAEYSYEKMTLVDSNGNQEARIVRNYTKEMNADQTRFLMVFDSPASVKGTALLTWSNDGAENDQWMFLPAQNRLQRIAKGSKKSYFMGTDFTFEDMEPEDIDNFNYNITGEENISGLPCWVIEAVPNNTETEKASGYSKRTLYVLKDYFFTVQIEFYDKRGAKIKTQQNGMLKKIDGNRFRSNKRIMTNHKTNHRTILEVGKREIDIQLDNDIFTERYITSGRHMN